MSGKKIKDKSHDRWPLFGEYEVHVPTWPGAGKDWDRKKYRLGRAIDKAKLPEHYKARGKT